MNDKLTTKKIVLCAFFAALTGVLSQVAIPMIPVPINLAMFSVFVAGGLLGARIGALSQIVYVLLGLIGIPVFSGFSGGVGVIVGPTGGYIVGYIVAAYVTGLILSKSGYKLHTLIGAMLVGLLLCYSLGTAWFMFVTKNSLIKSLMFCVIPFLIGDGLKIIGATIIIPRLKKQLSL